MIKIFTMWKGSSPSWSRVLLLLLLVGSFASCVTKKQIARAKKEYVYLQTGMDSVHLIPPQPENRIRPYVRLGISVNTPSLEKAQIDIFGGGRIVDYLVDSLGHILFPFIGKTRVAGLTAIDASEMIRNKIKTYVKDPFVQVSFEGFFVGVTGEVAKPGYFNLKDQPATLLNALALASYTNDLSRRDSIMLLRQTTQGLEKRYIDLRDSKSVFEPNNYYLQPNDLLVIAPNDRAIRGYVTRLQQQDVTSLQRINILATFVFILFPFINLFLSNR
jgi:polysaccharide export outer membrane protein